MRRIGSGYLAIGITRRLAPDCSQAIASERERFATCVPDHVAAIDGDAKVKQISKGAQELSRLIQGVSGGGAEADEFRTCPYRTAFFFTKRRLHLDPTREAVHDGLTNDVLAVCQEAGNISQKAGRKFATTPTTYAWFLCRDSHAQELMMLHLKHQLHGGPTRRIIP